MKQLEEKRLVIRISGAVQQSNLAEFEETALAVIASINTNLQTDDDFAQAEENIKSCQLIETRLKNAKNDALNNTKEISDLISTIDRLDAKFRQTRLDLNGKVKTEKESRKNEILSAARKELESAVSQSPVKHGFAIDFKALQEAIKGKRFLSKMREAVNEVVQSQLFQLTALEANYAHNIFIIEQSEKEYPGLFPDKKNLALSAPEVVSAMIESRVMKFKFDIAERERKAKEEAERKAERERLAKEAEAKRLSDEQDRARQQEELKIATAGGFANHQPSFEQDKAETIVPPPKNPFTDWTPPPPPGAPQSKAPIQAAQINREKFLSNIGDSIYDAFDVLDAILIQVVYKAPEQAAEIIKESGFGYLIAEEE